MKTLVPETPADYDHTRIIERPDGVYWLDADTGEEFGPFATLFEAVEDMQYCDDSDYEPCETLAEAEEELGLGDWLDPDTGELTSHAHWHAE